MCPCQLLSCRRAIKFAQTFDHTRRALKATINLSVLNRVKYLDGSSLDHHCTAHRWNIRFWTRSKNIGWILKCILLRTALSRTSCIAKSRLILYQLHWFTLNERQTRSSGSTGAPFPGSESGRSPMCGQLQPYRVMVRLSKDPSNIFAIASNWSYLRGSTIRSMP